MAGEQDNAEVRAQGGVEPEEGRRRLRGVEEVAGGLRPEALDLPRTDAVVLQSETFRLYTVERERQEIRG